ncbi:MAG TPA: sugar phosphate nucleotidyltransferase, partial [Desulfobacteria bacterium]|nr:sugar phosphate nucleotidyltransferase [Desulfobacteria bacterium]
KPMVPVLNKPVMTYAVELLKEHGITDIAVTLQYLPEAVKNYFGDGSAFGVNIEYFDELTPLGTAGSVKNASQFLDETFLVISGDGITDYDLTKAMEFHRQKCGIATMVMAKVQNPLEYGVIICDEDQQIIRFLEKPCWSEVFSDTVNTGIYILEPEIFDYYPGDVFFDFSKDLFPLLLSEGKPMFGYTASGYWSDIGSIQQYRQTICDIMNGLLKINIKGEQIKDGIWIGENTVLEPGVKIRKPVFIGDNCIIRNGAQLGEHAVIGNNNIISEDVTVRKSTVWDNILLDTGTSVDGSIVCNNVKIGQSSALHEGSVLGDSVVIGAGVTVKPEVKIWPDKTVNDDIVLRNSLIRNKANRMNLFSTFGVTGEVNTDLTPELTAKLAIAFGTALSEGDWVVISSDNTTPSEAIRRAMISGLVSTGVNVYDLGATTTPVARFVIKSLEVNGGLHIRATGGSLQHESVIEFLDSDGINVSKEMERKIENAIYQDDFRRIRTEGFGQIKHVPRLAEAYRESLLRIINQDLIKRRRFNILLVYDSDSLGWLIPPLADKLACQMTVLNSNDYSVEQMSKIIRAGKADFGVILNGNADSLAIVTDGGEVIREEIMLKLWSFITLDRVPGSKVGVPVYASSVIEAIADLKGGEVVRTKCGPRSLMEITRGKMFQPMFDGVYFLLKLLEYLQEKEINISDVLEQIPQMCCVRKEVYCPFSRKGAVMRQLVDSLKKEKVELLDGIKVCCSKGWTLILPDGEEPVFRVLSEAGNIEDAQELTDYYVGMIDRLKTVC